MDKKREQRLLRDIQLAHAKLNHLATLLVDVKKEVLKCQKKITDAEQKLKELHNES